MAPEQLISCSTGVGRGDWAQSDVLCRSFVSWQLTIQDVSSDQIRGKGGAGLSLQTARLNLLSSWHPQLSKDVT